MIVQIVYKVVKFYVLEMNLDKITQIVHNSNFYVCSFSFLALSTFVILGNQTLWAQNANFSIGQFQTPQGTHPHDIYFITHRNR